MDSLQTILQKLFIFRDCRAVHIREVLKICSSRTFKAGELLCKQGEKSEEMFIILSGSVQIDAADGSPLLSETAVTIIGEAGMLTGEQRLASDRPNRCEDPCDWPKHSDAEVRRRSCLGQSDLS